MWNDERIAIGKQFYWAIDGGQSDQVRALCADHPWLISDHQWDGEDIWLEKPAIRGNVEMMATLLDLGFNIDAQSLPEEGTALGRAIGQKQMEMVKFLLARGANPNVSRPLITAINITNRNPEETALEFVKLLVEHGADVNRLYTLYGDENNLLTALDWAEGKPAITKYLREHGAKSAAELHTESGKDTLGKADSQHSFADEVIAYFNEHIGPVNKRSQMQIVPTGHPIEIHAIEPEGGRKSLTLFTTGLSSKPMKVPQDAGDFALAELYIQLPGDWRYAQLDDPYYAWPVRWLRKMAQYPHEQGTWLGGPVTIIANDDPPQPLAPNVRFTSLMLYPDKSFIRRDSRKVQLYRMVPLFTEERDLEIREGFAALLHAFDRNSTPFVVDFARKNVGI